MIRRSLEPRLKQLTRQFPAILLLGPRQCGKTTLVRHFVDAKYFDLERPSDSQVFASDVEYALQRLKGPLILDEAQTLPALFPVLRSIIDDERRKAGQYYLLGSVSPVLVKGISESLAGRIGILELTPFLYAEVAGRRGVSIETSWLRGGYPDAFLAKSTLQWQDWQESYIRTFIQRDIAAHQLSLSAADIRRLLTMLAHQHGGLLNHSDLGRSLGCNYHTVQRALDLFVGYFIVRRLEPYHANLGKRLVKAPKVYLRDSGLLHHLLGIATADALLTSPARGNSFEGFMIQQIAALEEIHRPASRFYFFRTHAGAEIDLIIDRGSERIGVEFKAGVAIERHESANLRRGIEDGVIHRGIIAYQGSRRFEVRDGISVVPAEAMLHAGID
ncbi:MAG TPA: ATP-binding protein [Steroidobacteraceae bacterium]|nr:ATP-binding protein [Steroidobacteraceae bacterium]